MVKTRIYTIAEIRKAVERVLRSIPIDRRPRFPMHQAQYTDLEGTREIALRRAFSRECRTSRAPSRGVLPQPVHSKEAGIEGGGIVVRDERRHSHADGRCHLKAVAAKSRCEVEALDLGDGSDEWVRVGGDGIQGPAPPQDTARSNEGMRSEMADRAKSRKSWLTPSS